MFVFGHKLVDIRLQNCFDEIAEILVSTPKNRKTDCIHFLFIGIFTLMSDHFKFVRIIAKKNLQR